MKEPTISVIMAHYKREELLYRTLWAYRHQHTTKELKNVEFVIVDDDGGKSKTFWKVLKVHSKALNITAASMDEGTSNASGPMNYAAKLAVGDIFVLTNPENIPYTPHLLTEIQKKMRGKTKRHFSGACYALSKADTESLLNCELTSRDSFMKAVKEIKIRSTVYYKKLGLKSKSGWRQHSKYCSSKLFFLSALHRYAFLALGGFDEDYMKGQGAEDSDLERRAIEAGLEMHHTDAVCVFHQFHFGLKSYQQQVERESALKTNTATYKKKRGLIFVNEEREWGNPKSGNVLRRSGL